MRAAAISYDVFHEEIERADRAYDWTASGGLPGTLLSLGSTTMFERACLRRPSARRAAFP